MSGWPPEDEYLEETQSPRVDLADVVVSGGIPGRVRMRQRQKVGDSFSDLGLVWVYVNAGAHVCGEVQLGRPAVGSDLPTDSDEAAVVCTALLDEAVDDALDMVGLHVGQLCFRTDSEDALQGLLEERSVRNCLVRPDTVLVNQDFVSTDNRGDDRFSPGVRNHFSLDWQVDLDSH